MHWQEVSLQFEFDKPTNVEEIRLETLPVDSPAGPQFGRGGNKLMLFDVKPSIEDQDSKFTSLNFDSCTYLQYPIDETTADCIDYSSDTGWKAPPLPADATAHELILRFEEPIMLRADQRLTLTIDSGGADDLAVLNRIRFAFHQAAYAEAMTPKSRINLQQRPLMTSLRNSTTTLQKLIDWKPAKSCSTRLMQIPVSRSGMWS